MFCVALLQRVFLPYACISLLMECNSVFLHWRSLNNLKGYPAQSGYCRAVRLANLVTIAVFRFGVQAWILHWLLLHQSHLHPFYLCSGYGGNVVFAVFNYQILVRVLRADRGASVSFDRGVVRKKDDDSDK